MLDIKYVRENTNEVIARLGRRLETPSIIKILLMADARHREALSELETSRAFLNAVTKEIGELRRTNYIEEAVAKQVQLQTIKEHISSLEEKERAERASVSHIIAQIPNIPAIGVPLGVDETHNVEIRKGGVKPTFDFKPKEHFEIGPPLGMDFEAAARMSGSRFVVLKGWMARLERVLGQFMLDFHTERNGYLEIAPPLLVRSEAMFGTGQLPKFEEDLFKTTDGRYLIPTAEVSITNMVMDQVLKEEELGRFCALTPCFRAEAGSAGRDTRGMIRQHQFNKVELVSIVSEKTALDGEHERMLSHVTDLLDALGLHYRVMLLCSGDMGFSACKTYDVEVWLPGQNAYREISSVSYFGDFQGRRMNARYRPTGESKGTRFVHTFNGSAVAVGRCLVAILENYQRADGSVQIPGVLEHLLVPSGKRG